MIPRRPTVAHIIGRLVDEGHLDADRGASLVHEASATEPAPPLVIRLLVGSGAWAAAQLFLLFLAMIEFFDGELRTIALGVTLTTVALWLGRLPHPSDFVKQLALALSFTGVAATVAGVGDFTNSAVAASLTTVGVGLVLLRLFPDPVHRFTTTIAVSVAVVCALMQLHVWNWDVGLIAFVGAAYLAQLPPRSVARTVLAELQTPVAYGLGAAVYLGLFFCIGGFFGAVGSLGTAGVIGLVLLVGLRIVVGLPASERPSVALAVLGGAAIVSVGLLTRDAPGIMVSLGFLLLGIYRRRAIVFGASIVGMLLFCAAFYYRLDIPLAAKSQLLLASAAVFFLARWLVTRGAGSGLAEHLAGVAGPRRATLVVGLFVGLALVLGATNTLVVHKEQLVRDGRTVLLELAPVDPRSLMQGDYMRLRYKIQQDDVGFATRGDGRIVLSLDARGVGTFKGNTFAGMKLAANEQLLRYRARGRGAKIGAESFFFQEGQAKRFEQAAYGELRVSPSGQAVLVGLRDKQLRRIGRALH